MGKITIEKFETYIEYDCEGLSKDEEIGMLSLYMHEAINRVTLEKQRRYSNQQTQDEIKKQIDKVYDF